MFFYALIILSTQSPVTDGPAKPVRYSNHEFGYANQFTIGPGSTTGTAHYRWFGTDEVQDDLLYYAGTISFDLPEGIKSKCWLYRGVDDEGDEWWMAFEQVPSVGANYRIFTSHNESKDQPFKEWLVDNGSQRQTLTPQVRIDDLLRAKRSNRELLKGGQARNEQERFAVEIEWSSIGADLARILSPKESASVRPPNLIWFEDNGETRFGFTDSEMNRKLVTSIGLPNSALLNAQLAWRQTTRTIIVNQAFKAKYLSASGFDLPEVRDLLRMTMNNPAKSLRDKLSQVTSPKRDFIAVAKHSATKAVEVQTEPLQFYASPDGSFRYYWRAKVVAKPTGQQKLELRFETDFGTRHRTQTLKQMSWKRRTSHNAEIKAGQHAQQDSMPIPYLVMINGGESRKLLSPNDTVAQKFDKLEEVFLGDVKAALVR